MSDVVSFRPTSEDLELIEATRVRMGFDSRAEAIRFLLREAAQAGRSMRDEPVFRFRVPEEHRGGSDVTSRGIDRALYGSREE